jgi:hypothetical protein
LKPGVGPEVFKGGAGLVEERSSVGGAVLADEPLGVLELTANDGPRERGPS